MARLYEEGLKDHVLQWSIGDVSTENLFVNQVRSIPEKFSSVNEYRSAFRIPVLEELRAQIQQALQKTMASSSPSSTVFSPVRITKVKGTKNKKKTTMKRNISIRLLAKDRVTHRFPVPCFADLMLLCSGRIPEWDPNNEKFLAEPGSNARAKRSCGCSFALAFVTFGRLSPTIAADVYAQNEGSLLRQLQDSECPWFGVLLNFNLTPVLRIWNALHRPLADPLLLKSATDVFGHAGAKHASLGKAIESYCEARKLNESQALCLSSTVSSLLRKENEAKPNVRIVQGPPGTGKTTMLVTLLSVVGSLGLPTLVTAPTNMAVLEVCKRFMSLVNTRTLARSDLLQSDMVLVGSKERMLKFMGDSAPSLEKIFLPFRLTRLRKALGSDGWRHSAEALVKFLQDAHSHFTTFAISNNTAGNSVMPLRDVTQIMQRPKNSAGKASDLEGLVTVVSQKEASDNSICSFWRFARQRIQKLTMKMTQSCDTLLTDLPACLLASDTRQAMLSARDLANRLVHLIPSDCPEDGLSWFVAQNSNASRPVLQILDNITEKLQNLNLNIDADVINNICSNDVISCQKRKFLDARQILLDTLVRQPGYDLFKDSDQKKKWAQGRNRNWLRSLCLSNARLVFSTVSSAGGPVIEGTAFEFAIVDEASQLAEAETCILTGMVGLKQLLLVGDHMQLPAVAISQMAKQCGYGRSLFDRLQASQHPCRHLLNVQYRMHPSISAFPNYQFYGGLVQDGANVLEASYGSSAYQVASNLFGTSAFVDVQHGYEVRENKSWRNYAEVNLICVLIARLLQTCAANKIPHISVGVITPYRGQVESLKTGLKMLNSSTKIEVNTVDGFQGNEKDVILFSAVRSNTEGQIGFLDDFRRLNVAITRGRKCVWVVGNSRTLSKGGGVWKQLIQHARHRGCFHTVG
ncbi:unnamed protein product [Sphagnum troendelagicum]|uniref:Uncharacterized protein n=1 Tax=Sphagnum troendelagicum TaxID=128251 RepID=A0ABP0UTW3_9BRYO